MPDPSSDIEALVRKSFTVRESFVLPEGELEFQVDYGLDTKEKFVELKSRLDPLGFRPELGGSKEESVLVVRKAPPPSRRLPRLPVFFALFAAAAIVVSALLQEQLYRELAPSLSSYAAFFAFSVALAAILGAHELGQRLMARARYAGHANSYLIPWVPLLPPYLPTLGFTTSQSEPALNRDSLFDTVVAGTLALLGLVVVLYAVGDLTAVRSAVAFSQTPLANSTVTINPNVLQLSIDSLLSPLLPAVPPGYVYVSPIADASTVGFILAFLCLLPMASYDGGLLAHAAWGQRGARAAGYVSVLALLALDTPTYWGVAIVALVLVGRPLQLKLLDDVSPLSRSRRWLLIATLVIALLCLPIPKNLATIPLL